MTRYWLYYRLYPVGPLQDFVSSPAIGRIVDAARAQDPSMRWFYLQFHDPVGLHVRLRIEASEDRVDAVDSAVIETVRGCRVHRGTYSPETDKFGAGRAMTSAESVFHSSSELAKGTRASDRVGIAGAQMVRGLRLLDPSTRRSFLHRYWWYWSGGPAGKSPVSPDNDPRSPVVNRLVAQVAGLVDVPAIDAYAQALERSTLQQSAATRDRLVFHHTHLTNNRLGVAVGGEARLARLLWLADQANMTLCTPELSNVQS